MGVDFWGALVGAAVGVVAGTVVQFLVQKLLNSGVERDQRAALKKEMLANQQLIDELQGEATRFRNAINGDAVASYFGFFNYERGIFDQGRALLSAGLLYKWFEIDDLRKLQLVAITLSQNTSNFINQTITDRRDKAKTGQGYDKYEMLQFANFVDNQLADTKKLVTEFIKVI